MFDQGKADRDAVFRILGKTAEKGGRNRLADGKGHLTG